MNTLALLDELRIIAQNGLAHADDEYDRERYGRLLELAAEGYGEAFDLPPAEVRERFADEVGYATPKLGAAAAVFDGEGRILLMERADNGDWCLPGGYVDPGETPAETAVREAREETGLDVEPVELAAFYHHPPDAWRPHGAVDAVYLCARLDGELELSHEGTDLQYWRIEDVPAWHMVDDHHRTAALDAREVWAERAERG